MASPECPATAIQAHVLKSVEHILWGKDIRHEVFKRWTQGFRFSEHESTALLQEEGGPCAVIAPVQAYLLKNILFSSRREADWRNISNECRSGHLCQAFIDILGQVHSDGQPFVLVQHRRAKPSSPIRQDIGHSSSSIQNGTVDNQDDTSAKRPCLGHEDFHSNLCVKLCHSREALPTLMPEILRGFESHYGVLLFLYSVLLTKGMKIIKEEVEDPLESLIDTTHGHGSQNLINLLLTGKAVSNVWDNDKDLSGLCLRGIQRKSIIGFLSLLEHLRYLEVGWNYKNPMVPVWLLGSETHLTVLFSIDERLVDKETPESKAQQVFRQFDTENRGFIASSELESLLQSLDLVSDREYVGIVCEKLDPEELGIITLKSFMDEFFPREHKTPDEEDGMRFSVFHYNGIVRSNHDNKVAYREGQALLPNMPDLQVFTEGSPIRSCLMTKWPTIELTWSEPVSPSLN